MSVKKRPPLRKYSRRLADNQNAGRPLVVNRAVEDRFRKSLLAMVRLMISTTLEEIDDVLDKPTLEKFYAQDANPVEMVRKRLTKLRERFEKYFYKKAFKESEGWINNLAKSTANSLASSLENASGFEIKIPPLEGRTKEVIEASILQSASLIESIPAEFVDRVSGVLLRSLQSGGPSRSDVIAEVKHAGAITKRRASLIARDQTSKATTALNAARMKDTGFTKFQWLHSGGGAEPRKLHLQLDGQVFDIDNPPVADERTGERALPGYLINCRCRMIPVADYDG